MTNLLRHSMAELDRKLDKILETEDLLGGKQFGKPRRKRQGKPSYRARHKLSNKKRNKDI